MTDLEHRVIMADETATVVGSECPVKLVNNIINKVTVSSAQTIKPTVCKIYRQKLDKQLHTMLIVSTSLNAANRL